MKSLQEGSEVKAKALPGKWEFFGKVTEIIDPLFGPRLYVVREKCGAEWLRTSSEIHPV